MSSDTHKKRVNISLDPELYRRAKMLGLNVSGVSERALRVYLDRLEHGGGQGDAVLGLNGVEKSTEDERSDPGATTDDVDEDEAKYADASTDELLDEYREYASTVLNRSEGTIDKHTRYVGRLIDHAGKPPSQIEEGDIAAYINSEGDISDATKNNIIGSIRVFFRDFLDRDVASAFETTTERPTPTDVPSKEELQTFHEAISNPNHRALFLMYATSGLRSGELIELTTDQIDEDKQMLVPESRSAKKATWVTFYNDEAADAFEAYKRHRDADTEEVFPITKSGVTRAFQRISDESGVKITVQMLRRWFASEMSRLGVDGEYIDAFCGRTKSSVLEKHYLDYSPERLKEIYDEAGITVLE